MFDAASALHLNIADTRQGSLLAHHKSSGFLDDRFAVAICRDIEQLAVKSPSSGLAGRGSRRASCPQQTIEAFRVKLQRPLVGGERFRRMLLFEQQVAKQLVGG